mmetsp:Transcript_10651/g.19655  ORF Transcript_10651/g.19655 Transcript_10651/m.19655 type:complete len:94 (-) Transcript_10651:737-1018(-)
MVVTFINKFRGFTMRKFMDALIFDVAVTLLRLGIVLKQQLRTNRKQLCSKEKPIMVQFPMSLTCHLCNMKWHSIPQHDIREVNKSSSCCVVPQ